MDTGSRMTDRYARMLEPRIIEVYTEAKRDIEAKTQDFMDRYKVKESIHQRELDEGKITQEQFDSWKRGQVFQGEQWNAKRDQIVQTISSANEVAVKMVNGERGTVFSFNANYQAYKLEHGAGVNFGFQLYDSSAVTNLIKNDPQILPQWKIDEPKDYTWNAKKVNNAVTQGIIQGERLDQIADRLVTGLCTSNQNKMLTFARTGMTQAQNAGRLQRLEEAEGMGIKVQKKWMATLDGHTRWSHADLDGQKRPINEPFQVGGYKIRYPGDPTAHPSMVYNCRCTLVSELNDYPSEYERYDNIDGKPIKNMTYREWEQAKGKSYSKSPYTSPDFHSIRDSLGNSFVDAMETLLNFGSEEDAKDLFYKYQDKLKVTDAHESGGAYYSPQDGGVHINAEKIQQGDSLHGPYQTAFHEFAHNIDNVSAGGGDQWLSREYKNGLLEKKIKEDWNDFRVKYLVDHTDEWVEDTWDVRRLLREMAEKDNKDDYYSSPWYDIVRQVRSGELSTEDVLSKYGNKMARHYLSTGYNTKAYIDYKIIDMLKSENMPLHARGSISDVIGGIQCASGGSNAYPLGAGHKSEYWWETKVNKAGAMIKVSSHNQPLEFFAEVIDGKASNPESLAQLRRIFPRSVGVVESIIQEMIK